MNINHSNPYIVDLILVPEPLRNLSGNDIFFLFKWLELLSDLEDLCFELEDDFLFPADSSSF